ncbi:hypothetical protein E2C01_013041 [Portunus trituberculatus]|uniref:Uncharacterized protein n=1 Tax=Portunus trituberculatus TaxID=210409 RepID=A0A5B7DFF1_PORTR|nr:hypothetical protein [Portunus trituberculatus]
MSDTTLPQQLVWLQYQLGIIFSINNGIVRFGTVGVCLDFQRVEGEVTEWRRKACGGLDALPDGLGEVLHLLIQGHIMKHQVSNVAVFKRANETDGDGHVPCHLSRHGCITSPGGMFMCWEAFNTDLT